MLGEIGGNVEEEIFGSHAYNISGATRGRHGEDVDIIVGGNETRQVNGTYDLSVRSNIFATSLTGNVDLTAFNNLSLSTTSGIFSAKSGTTLNIKSGEAMTIKSETTLTETVTTNAVRTVGGTLTILLLELEQLHLVELVVKLQQRMVVELILH